MKAAHLAVSFLIVLQAVQRTVKFVAFLSKLRQAKGAEGFRLHSCLSKPPLRLRWSEQRIAHFSEKLAYVSQR